MTMVGVNSEPDDSMGRLCLTLHNLGVMDLVDAFPNLPTPTPPPPTPALLIPRLQPTLVNHAQNLVEFGPS